MIAIPIIGAIVGFFFRKNPTTLSRCFLTVTIIELIALLFSAETSSPTLALWVVLSASLSVLARYRESKPTLDLFDILILTGLGLGVLWSPGQSGFIFLAGIFALLVMMQLRTIERSASETSWVIGLYGIAILLLFVSPFFSAQHKTIALSLVYAMLLPLFPLHGAYTVLLKRLPGTLPAFLSLFLPVLGLHGLLPLLPMLPPEIKSFFLLCAIFGMIIGGLRSLAQKQMSGLLSQSALVFWSILWWYLASATVNVNAALTFFSAVAFSLCGLFLIAHGLKARYGDLLIDQFGGLASVMPRFSLLFVLLCMAAMGLPLFGLFSGFIALAFSTSSGFSWSLLFTLLAWGLVSWRIPTLMSKLLFDLPNAAWIYHDFNKKETTALTVILILLFLLGIAPHTLLELKTFSGLSTT